jgi:hypothetical protein
VCLAVNNPKYIQKSLDRACEKNYILSAWEPMMWMLLEIEEFLNEKERNG